MILATKSLILFSSFAYLASQPARVRIASSSPFVEFYESHTHTLLTCLLERANNSVKRTDIPLSPSVTRLPQTSEYYRCPSACLCCLVGRLIKHQHVGIQLLDILDELLLKERRYAEASQIGVLSLTTRELLPNGAVREHALE